MSGRAGRSPSSRVVPETGTGFFAAFLPAISKDAVPGGVDVALLLRRAQLRKQMACEAALAQAGMTLPQWGILYAIAAEPDSSTHALALFTGQSDQAAGAVIARLEQRGLLERRPGFGKAILHRLTPDGSQSRHRPGRRWAVPGLSGLRGSNVIASEIRGPAREMPWD